jgi:hypothetical protein
MTFRPFLVLFVRSPPFWKFHYYTLTRQTEIRPNCKEHAGSSPEITSFGAPIPRIRAEHAGDEYVGDDEKLAG